MDSNEAPGQTFRDRLRFLISDKNNGLLIDARDDIEETGLVVTREKRVFKLTNGHLTRQYITSWGVFRDAAILRDTIVGLADAAEGALDQFGPISHLATATATGLYLTDYVHAELLRRGRADLQTAHFGDYSPGEDLETLRGHKVLLITDVVATGRRVREIVRKVEEKGASVGAVVAIVATVEKESDEAPPFVLSSQGRRLPLVTLTDYPLPGCPEPEEASDVVELTPGEILKRIIADRKNGMLVGPAVTRRDDKSLAYEPNEVYVGPSGGIQRHFITLWPLFEKPLYFDDCMDHLADLARQTRERDGNFFTTIVTCTATARHLMEHLQPRIETSDSPVEAIYLGPFPFQALAKYGSTAFKDKTVLILADVIASARLVTNIASVVHRLGGAVKGVLAVVALQTGSTYSKKVEFGYDQEAEIESLCQFPITADETDTEGAQAVSVDPEVILPIERGSHETNGCKDRQVSLPARTDIHFKVSEAILHFDSADAIRFGLFEGGARSFTAGISLKRLFGKFGSEIRCRIERVLAAYKDQPLVIVTTTDRDDLRFLDLVDQWSAVRFSNAERPVVIPRLDSIEFDFASHVPKAISNRLASKHVLVLISTVQTAEKLRRIVALLTQSGVCSVTVICLLNRMGSLTEDFTTRVRSMTSGLGTNGEAGHFQFYDLYKVCDLSGQALLSTVDAVEHLARQYSDRTPANAFKSFIDEEMRYFRIRPYHSLENTAACRERLDSPRLVSWSEKTEDVSATVTTKDGLFYALYAKSQAEASDPSELVVTLVAESERARIYLLLTLLLSSIAYLRLAKKSEDIKRWIVEAVDEKRKSRLALESKRCSGDSDEELFQKIGRITESESYLLFCLALFCYLDHHPDRYLPWIQNAVDGGMSPDDTFESYPLNFQAYFATGRTLWAASLLWHFAHLEKSVKPAELKQAREKLISISLAAQRAAGKIQVKALAGDLVKTWERRIKYSFDAFLTDLGFHDFGRRRDKLVVFLRNRVSIAPHHNAIVKDLRAAVEKLNSQLWGRTVAKPVVLPPNDWKPAVDRGIQAASLLKTIGDGAAELFDFTPELRSSGERFVASAAQEGFRKDVDLFYSRLTTIRSNQTVAWQDINRLTQVQMRFGTDFEKEDSPLRRAIDSYQVSLLECLLGEMANAQSFLEKDYPKVWTARAKSLSEQAEKEQIYVCCDKSLLRETLWNVLTNVRYGLYKNPGVSQRPRLTLNLDNPNLVEIHVASKFRGTQLRIGPGTTLYRQQQELLLWGCELTTSVEAKHAVVHLKLNRWETKEA